MKTKAASILIMLGCVGIMPNTHAEPSPSPKPKPRGNLAGPKPGGNPTTRLDGTIGQSSLGLSSGGSYNPTPSPHGYVGRNDGKVQQSTTAGKQTTSGKPTQSTGKFQKKQGVNAQPAGSPVVKEEKMRRVLSVLDHPVETGGSLAGTEQGQGKPASGKKKGEKVSPTSSPR